jgi:hypothetical protein
MTLKRGERLRQLRAIVEAIDAREQCGLFVPPHLVDLREPLRRVIAGLDSGEPVPPGLLRRCGVSGRANA